MRIWIGPVLALLLAPVASATTRKVPADFPTIQAAINACFDGDTVLVSSGTYNEKIDFLGKDITVTSVGGASVTTIHAPSGGSVVTFKNGETLAAVLSGFTINGGTGTVMGSGTDTFGGGIFCSGASPTIKLNVITSNTARGNIIFNPGGSGGGIFVMNGSPSISQNSITSNTAEDDGGGICCTGSGSTVVDGNTITLNFAGSGSGGGVCRAATVTNNDIESNFGSNNGGGVLGGTTISGNTIKNNGSLVTGGGISCGAATVTRNLIDSNTTGILGGFGGGIECSGAAVITANVIIRNRSVGDGGGIHCASGTAKIASNLIVRNHVDFAGSTAFGGGMDCSGASPILTNNTFALNAAQDGAGAILASASTVITNCIFWDDTAPSSPEISGSPAVTFSDVEGGFGGAGNINVDPQFANAASDDFHIKPTSPCLNAGSNAAPGLPAIDFENDARIHYGTVDMGGDEIASCVVLFQPFGVGLAGSGGFVPSLDGSEGSCDAGGHIVHIANGLGGAKGNLWIGVTSGDLPFYGGHFYVGFGGPWTTVPIKLKGGAGVPGAGFLDIPGSNVNAFPGLVVYMQVSLADPGAIHGVSLTSGCKVTIGE